MTTAAVVSTAVRLITLCLTVTLAVDVDIDIDRPAPDMRIPAARRAPLSDDQGVRKVGS
jgi:hypothetical protein